MQRSSARKLGWVFFAGFLVVFFLVASGLTYSLDVKAFDLVNQTLHRGFLDPLFYYASRYGRSYFWIPVVFVAWVAGGERYKKGALMMAAVFVVIIAVGLFLKAIYYRPRPFDVVPTAVVLMRKPTDSSFPSGHALIVFGGATVALLYFKKRYSLPLLAEALMVGYSRVYVGLHFPTDVIAGALLGSSLALLVYGYWGNTWTFDGLYSMVKYVYDRIIKLF